MNTHYPWAQSLAHAHCFQLGYPRVPISKGKNDILFPNELNCVIKDTSIANRSAFFTFFGTNLGIPDIGHEMLLFPCVIESRSSSVLQVNLSNIKAQVVEWKNK